MTTTPDALPESIEAPEPVCFVWEQEDSVQTGTLGELVKAVSDAQYGFVAYPQAVITRHDGAWTDVSLTVAHDHTDADDWMHYTLTCSWADRHVSVFYTIDGRA